MTSKSDSIAPAKMTKELVLAKCNYFVDVHLWPLQRKLNPELWLENFEDNEMEYAVTLLHSFLYLTDDIADQLFISAFQMLSNKIIQKKESFISSLASWRSFIDNIIVTPVTGEDPNASDSGFGFVRKARKLIGIKESQLMSQEEAIKQLYNTGQRPIVFVDDFVGSGNQFIETWNRLIDVTPYHSVNYNMLSKLRGGQFYYCPLVCTEYGYDRLQSKCPEVKVYPVHLLPSKYSALANDSIIWPDHLKSSAVDFIKQSSSRAGIPDTDGGKNDWRGFHKLGLALTFEDSVPDATLPIFYWEKNGWKPLIKKN